LLKASAQNGRQFQEIKRAGAVLWRKPEAEWAERETVGAQRVLVEVNLHLPGSAAVGVWQLDARDRREHGSNEIHGKIVERRLGESEHRSTTRVG
jgi:hypothetical protein